ncbi:DUF2911 domain-containing protein [Reichenbachiella carrageenanivorans]|uniref:DUF2911 domain-containing protein n=1 Tax=Reichenbachiella carrageenanivorans TaxID=2979869 RepID=A0ABY6CX55_9BACT|nr:DUF2911 domain-containing protein [Reichenbachiella carrageenanivorans]UXX78482.1 DUF2911 domain-containing protein [Reichenbachiella carrageenanivorans]
MNMKLSSRWVLVVILTPLALSGCYRPEYPSKFISSDLREFESYQKKCASRPSPPARSLTTIDRTDIFVTYSQPAVKERKIWGGLVPYHKVWRTGANEATVLSATGDILVNGDTLLAGNYALYTIPAEDKWTVILNTKYEVWGAYDYDQSLDVLRFDVVPTIVPDISERLTFEVDETGIVYFAWDRLRFDFKVQPL